MTNNTSNWQGWGKHKPPVKGAFRTKKGWEFEHPNGAREIIVSMQGDQIPPELLEISLIDISLPTSGTIGLDQSVDVVLMFDKPVAVSGNPKLKMVDSFNEVVELHYKEGHSTEALIFTYQPTHKDIYDLRTLSPKIDYSEGYIRSYISDTKVDQDISHILKLYKQPEIKIDNVKRELVTVIEQRSTSFNRTTVIIKYNDIVLVEGTPKIEVFEKGFKRPMINLTADYVSGSGSQVLIFEYHFDEKDEKHVPDIGDRIILDEHSKITTLDVNENVPLLFPKK